MLFPVAVMADAVAESSEHHSEHHSDAADSSDVTATNSNPLPDWKLVKDKSGVKVYTRLLPGRTLKSFKGITEVKSDLASIFQLFQNVDSLTQWMHTVSEVTLLSSESGGKNYLVHTKFDAPWPVSNRDVILQGEWHHDPEASVLSVMMQNADGVKPAVKKHVRMPYLKASYLFETTNTDSVKITYEADADPGGLLPDWIVNMVAVDTPFHTLKNLRNMDYTPYQGQPIDFTN